jgi:hypothetical protein
MRDRLEKRGTETEQSIAKRCSNAIGEIEALLSWREKVNYRIFNDDLAISKKVLNSLLLALYPEELQSKEIIAHRESNKAKPAEPEPANATSLKLGLTIAMMAAGAVAGYLISKRH